MVQIVSNIRCSALAVLCCTGLAFAAPKNFDVDCDSRDTVSGALEKADPGDVIRIRGVCQEKVTVMTDRITLAGMGGAVIRGGMVRQGVELDGLVTVDGARGVVIRNLTIQRSRAEGIFGTRGAAFLLENVTLQDNADAGLRAASSTLDITGCTSRRNMAGFDLFNGTQTVFRGNIVANDNRDVGIFLGGTSSFEVRGARIEASNNNSGIVANSNSHIGFWFFNGTQTDGGSITASGNRATGVLLANASMEIYSRRATITARNNAIGISLVGTGGLASPFPNGGVQIVLENNGVGLDMGAGASAVVVGGLTARNNTTAGIVADNATLTLISVPFNPSIVTSNTLDIDARFGSRLTVDGVAFSNKKCEPSVLARGVPACP